jgi:hypothetical protein
VILFPEFSIAAQAEELDAALYQNALHGFFNLRLIPPSPNNILTKNARGNYEDFHQLERRAE